MADTLKLNAPQVKMVAHRGLSGIELENTCAAFVAAGNRDYYGIETDVHRTADGAYVVIHDDRTGRVAFEDIPVEGSTFAQLQAVALKDKDGEPRTDLKIPTLKEYLKICKKYNKVPVLELKNPFPKEDVANILEIVKGIMSLEEIVFISFAYQNMVYLRELAPDARLQFLTGKEPVGPELIQKLKDYRLDLDISWKVLDEAGVKLLHEAGIEVNVWTVDDPEMAKQLIAWGVDYITSNILQYG